MTISYLFLAVGDKESIHNQVYYAILSLLANTSNAATVYVLTDAPERYDWFYPRVQCLPVSSQQLDEWRGPKQFFFRIKIKAMQHLAAEIKNNLVYLDSDIVCLQPLNEFENRLQQGEFFMHVREFYLANGPSKTTRQMWKVGAHKTFGSLRIDEQSLMWNAGVVAMPFFIREYLETSLIACDAMCQSSMRPLLTEQFALSLTLQQSNNLAEAKDYFLHYWGNKDEWQKKMILPFLEKIRIHAWTLNEAINHFDKNQILPAMKVVKKSFFKKLFASTYE